MYASTFIITTNHQQLGYQARAKYGYQPTQISIPKQYHDNLRFLWLIFTVVMALVLASWCCALTCRRPRERSQDKTIKQTHVQENLEASYDSRHSADINHD
jgi:heme/copper-type cytochrome/quinol oxidase subunit 2